MQYMLLIYGDESKWKDMPEAERNAVMRDFGEFTQGIVKSGHFSAGSQLASSTTATTVREKRGKCISTDGPFVETKEQLGGYYLVECKDLDEAIAIAARIPSLRVGDVVEVRPLVPTSEAAKTPPSR